jgi:hypothetical protein
LCLASTVQGPAATGETRVRDESNGSRNQPCCGSASALCIQPHMQRLRTTVRFLVVGWWRCILARISHSCGGWKQAGDPGCTALCLKRGEGLQRSQQAERNHARRRRGADNPASTPARRVGLWIAGHTLNPARHAKRSFPVLLALAAGTVGGLCIWASLELCGTK